MARTNIITRMINWISGRYIKTVNHESIFGAGNIAGGGSGSLDPGDGIRIQDGIVSAKVDNTTIGFDINGNLKTLGEAEVTKQYVDNQDQALQDQIDLKQDEITDSIDTHDITDSDYLSDFNETSNKRRSVMKLWSYILSKMAGAISTAIESNFIAGRALITNANGKLIESQVSAVELSYVKDVTSSIQDQLDNKLEKRTGTDVEVYSHNGTSQGGMSVKTSMSSTPSDSNLLTEKGISTELNNKIGGWNYVGILSASSGSTLTVKDDWTELLAVMRVTEGANNFNIVDIMPKFGFTQGSPTNNQAFFGFFWNENYNAKVRLGLSGTGDNRAVSFGFSNAVGWAINGIYIYKR